MRKIRIYILEDEIITQELLRECLETFGYEVCGAHHKAEQALEEIQDLRPDMAVLDINVKGKYSGVWLGNQLNIPFIYLTAYNDTKTIHSALETKPASYLIKPFEDMQVFAAVELAMKDVQKPSQSLEAPKKSVDPYYNLEGELVVKDGHSHHKIKLYEIYYIKSDGKYIDLHLKDKRLTLRTSLVNFLNDYPSDNFVRVHKSYIVNRHEIESFTKTYIQILNCEIPISRSYKNDFLVRVQNSKER